jgi:hypothetical protein
MSFKGLIEDKAVDGLPASIAELADTTRRLLRAVEQGHKETIPYYLDTGEALERALRADTAGLRRALAEWWAARHRGERANAGL